MGNGQLGDEIHFQESGVLAMTGGPRIIILSLSIALKARYG